MIKQFGYDMLPVLAGVLLALLINNYQQSRQEKRFVERVLKTVVEENASNIESIDRLLENQQQTLDSLNYYAEDESYSVFDIIQKLGGLQMPDLFDHGSKFLLNYDQTLVDIEVLLRLSRIQEELENYDLAVNKIVDTLYDHLYESDTASKRRLAIILNDLLNYERNIRKLSEDFNKLLKQQ